MSFSRYACSELGGDPVLSDRPNLRVYRHPLGSAGALRRPERSCRRWQLLSCGGGFTRTVTYSACPSSFVTGVESESATGVARRSGAVYVNSGAASNLPSLTSRWGRANGFQGLRGSVRSTAACTTASGAAASGTRTVAVAVGVINGLEDQKSTHLNSSHVKISY